MVVKFLVNLLVIFRVHLKSGSKAINKVSVNNFTNRLTNNLGIASSTKHTLDFCPDQPGRNKIYVPKLRLQFLTPIILDVKREKIFKNNRHLISVYI